MLFRWLVISTSSLGFFGLLYGFSTSSHHTAFTVADTIQISWAFLWSMIFGTLLWLKVRTK